MGCRSSGNAGGRFKRATWPRGRIRARWKTLQRCSMRIRPSCLRSTGRWKSRTRASLLNASDHRRSRRERTLLQPAWWPGAETIDLLCWAVIECQLVPKLIGRTLDRPQVPASGERRCDEIPNRRHRAQKANDVDLVSTSAVPPKTRCSNRCAGEPMRLRSASLAPCFRSPSAQKEASLVP